MTEEDLEDRLVALEGRVAELEKRGGRRRVDPAAAKRGYALRDQSVSRVLAGASARLGGRGHRWIKERLDARALLGYSFALAAAVSGAAGDVHREVNRAVFVMQLAVASILGKTPEEVFA